MARHVRPGGRRRPRIAARATIFALSSGAPPAAIGVVRLSGPAAFAAVERLTGRAAPAPRRAVLRDLRDAEGAPLDRALLLVFAGRNSATGEDLAELHLHGGRAVIDSVLRALAVIDGLRPAEPGEFTRRAFENGRIDLAEAEGLSDLLRAETEAQRRNALAMAGGALSRRIEDWQARLLRASALVEAQLDFSDEGDVEAAPDLSDLVRLGAEMRAMLDAPGVERLRDGVRVAIAGPPNSGKSTLLNALAGREAAIVSPIAGTTRDVIEAPLAIDGLPFLLSDLAGLREATDDPIERIGIERANAALAAADILLWLGDGPPPDGAGAAIRVHARADLPGRTQNPPDREIAVSAVRGEGIAHLLRLLVERARALLPREGEVALSRRQTQWIGRAANRLAEATGETNPLILAEHLRSARASLDALTGRAGTDEMLDALFGAFCIGK